MHVSLIIPALDEAECLGSLLAEVLRGLVDQLIVVDNGSTDNTSQVAREAGAVVIYEPRRGYGYACMAGSAIAEGDILVFMDGDGSFVPGEMPILLEPLAQNKADLVLGSRTKNHTHRGVMPFHQHFGNHLFTWLLKKRYGLAITDLGPYRAIRRELLLALDMQEYTHGWPLEMIIKTARNHRLIVEQPITYRPRLAGRSKVSGTLRGTFLTAYRFSRVMFRYAYR
jgi:glycosyltransferase involved in cell wall biosynthesis